MNRDKLQEQRLDYLLEEFMKDSDGYENLEIPDNISDKRRILRSLMNIRIPKKMSEAVLRVQDEYLVACAEEKGIVELSDIPVVKKEISIWQGDITRLKVDVVVNAANSAMLGCFIPLHTCIDNQIHTFAGIQLREECNLRMNESRLKYGEHHEQPTSLPMLTDAYNLPAKKVIHIVGPIVKGQLTEELEEALSDCYKNTLDMCMENNLKSVAFCCISTGVFHFPNKRAAEIAVDTVEKWLIKHPNVMDRVIFNVFKDEDRKYYEELL
ncbi:protein-ADP-ribose hydrolase [Peptoniphilaceae bacterium SGI.131]